MKTEQIRLALEIAKSRSISEAADTLDISQPTASNMLKALEGELGYQLFSRSRAGMSLTKEGVRFIEYAQMINNSLEAIQRINASDKRVEFRIVAMGSDFSELVFEKFCERCISMKADFDLCFQKISLIDQAIRMVKAGEGDLAFIVLRKKMFENYHKSLAQRNLVMIPVSETHVNLTVRRGHPLIQGDKIAYDQLYKYPCIAGMPLNGENLYTPNFFVEDGVEIRRTVTIEQGPSWYHLLEKIDGFLYSVPLSEEILESYDLVSFPLEDSQLCFFVVYQKESTKMKLIQEFLATYQMLLRTSPNSSETPLQGGLSAM